MEKKNVVIMVILLFIAGVLVGVGGYNVVESFRDKKEDNVVNEKDDDKNELKDEQSQEKEITDVQLKELLSIILLSSTNSGEYGLIDFFPHAQEFAKYDNDQEIVISNLDNTKLQQLIYNYALNNNITMKMINGAEYELCASGEGVCKGINTNDAKTIAEKYNLDIEKVMSNMEIYNGMYLYSLGGDVSIIDKMNHSVTAMYDGEDIILEDIATVGYNEDYAKENGVKETGEEKIKYTFKKGQNLKYYLYSMYAVEN